MFREINNYKKKKKTLRQKSQNGQLLSKFLTFIPYHSLEGLKHYSYKVLYFFSSSARDYQEAEKENGIFFSICQ